MRPRAPSVAPERAWERWVGSPWGGFMKEQNLIPPGLPQVRGGSMRKAGCTSSPASCLQPHKPWLPAGGCILTFLPKAHLLVMAGRGRAKRRPGEREEGVTSRRPHKAQRQLFPDFLNQVGRHARLLEFQKLTAYFQMENLHKLMLN